MFESFLTPRGWGGGGYSPQFWYVCAATKWGSPELTAGCVWLALWPVANPGALPEHFAFELVAVSRPWVAINGLKWKKFWKLWYLERQTKIKWWCLIWSVFLVICENDMLRSRNVGLKLRVSRAASTPPPPPPPSLTPPCVGAWHPVTE